MHTKTIFKLITTSVLAAGVLLSAFTASAATFGLIPVAQLVPDGNDFSVDVIAYDLPADTIGGGIDFSWAGDATLNSVYLATQTPDADNGFGVILGLWENDWSGTGTIGASSLTGLYVNNFGGLSGGQQIARLNFTLGTGTVTVSAMDSALENAGGWAAAPDSGYYELTNTYGEAVINPAVIPVPAALWLFGSGLIGLVGVARRRI